MWSLPGISLELLIGGTLLTAGAALLAKIAWVVRQTRRQEKQRLASEQTSVEQVRQERDLAPAEPIAFKPPITWQGYRRFVVADRVEECADITSYYLEPEDGRPIASFVPGQFLTLRSLIPGDAKPTVRCYSLSDKPQPDHYRITVKAVRTPAVSPELPPGKMSNFLQQQVHIGDVLDVQAPRGDFTLQQDERPPILIGAGIGVTPLLSMAYSMLESGFALPVVLFMGVRNGREHPFRNELYELSQQYKNFLYVPCYSQPLAEDLRNRDYRFAQRIDMDLIRRIVPYNNFPFYLCGPSSFMGTIVAEMIAWGVHTEDLHFEAFGPSTVRSVTPRPAATANPHGLQSRVVFSESHKTEAWNDECQSILELAESLGVNLPSGCRSGNCGMCATKVLKGKVRHTKHPAAHVEPNECLACLAHPDGSDVVLQA